MRGPNDKPHDEKAPGGITPGVGGAHGPAGEDVSLLEQLAEFSQSAGEFGSAMDYYDQILRIAERARESSSLQSHVLFRVAVCHGQMGDYAKALEALDSALAALPADATEEDRCPILNERAYALIRLGRYQDAESDVREVTERVLDRKVAGELARAQKSAGTIAMWKGDWSAAGRAFEASLAAYRMLDDRSGTAQCLNNLGLLEKSRGHAERAIAYLREALEHVEDLGDTHDVASCLNNLGLLEFKVGRWESARDSWERAARMLEGIGNKWEVANVSLNLGNYYRHMRDWEEAESFYQRARDLVEQLGEARELVLVKEFQGDLALAAESYDAARTFYLEALAGGRELAPRGDLVLEARRRLADLESRVGHYVEARQHLAEGLELSTMMDESFERGVLLRIQGRLQSADGDILAAVDSYRGSLNAHAACEAPFELGLTRLEFATFCIENIIELEDAAAHLEAARNTFEEIGASYEAGHAYLMAAKLEMVCDHPTGEARLHLEAAMDLLDRVGSDDDRETLREVNRDIDRLLEETSLSERNDLAALNEAVSRIRAAEDAHAKVREIERALEERMNADRVGLFLISTDTGGLVRAPGSSLSPDDARTAREIVRQLGGDHRLGSKPLVSTSPARDPRFAAVQRECLLALGSVAFMPLVSDEEVIGGLYVDLRREAGYFHQPELDFLVAFAAAAGMAVQEMRLEAARTENLRLRRQLTSRAGFEGIITQNRRMLEIIELIERLRDSRATLLIQGETGTGKELLARATHAVSVRSQAPLVTVNCAALARDVLESELFGHVKGAFTDARADKIGLFEQADGGTIFLDEIDKTSTEFQERLLRTVDQGEVKPVGSNDVRKVDVRILCATNRPLRTLVEEGHFLKDLYYRLRVISIDLPPLRDRKGDVPLLVDHFLERLTRASGKAVEGFTHEAMNRLVAYAWPGNVRDLFHEVERAFTIAEDGARIDVGDLAAEIRDDGNRKQTIRPNQSLQEYVEEIERDLVVRALRKTDGNRSHAAKLLGLSRRGLLNKITRYAINL